MYVIFLPYSHLHCTKRIRNGVQILPFNNVGVLSLKSTSSPVQMLDVNKITLPATISSEEHDPIAKNWDACFLCKFNIWRRTAWKLKYLGGTNLVATLLVNLCEIMFHWSTCFQCVCVCVCDHMHTVDIHVSSIKGAHDSSIFVSCNTSYRRIYIPMARPFESWWG